MLGRFWFAALGALAVLGCGEDAAEDTGEVTEGIGEPCTLSDEDDPHMAGFAVQEVVVEETSGPELVCLGNHFRGRIGCPYGQTEADLALPATAPERCRTPDGVAVAVAVEPQLSGRREASAVYTSCRCNGPDPEAEYCTCPASFSCTHLIDDLGSSSAAYAGSYCVANGTAYDPGADYGPACSRNAAPGEPGHCG